MEDRDNSPHGRGTRIVRRLALVVPATVLVTMAFGSTGAFAAPSPTAATHSNPQATPNMGVGQGNGVGNATHEAALTSTSTSTSTASDAQPAASDTATSHVTDGTAGTSGDVSKPQPVSTADANSGGANGQCSGTPQTNGIYCSTRQGDPSGNGNQVAGNHTGEPCAGCVGKADNKNPPGQEKSNPMGTFPNNGYECDHNNGIGKTNPAHTGCTSPTTGGGGGDCTTTGTCPKTCPDGSPLPASGVCPTQCPEGTVSGSNGDCQPPCVANPDAAGCKPPCPEGEMLSNGSCVPTPQCQPSAANNNCQPTTPNCTPTAANNFCSTVLGEKKTKTPQPPKTVKKVVLGEKTVRTPPGALPFTGLDIRWMLATGGGGLLLGSGLLLSGRRRRSFAS